MKQQIVRVMVFCAACLVLGVQAQSSGGSSGSSGSSSSSSPGSSESTSGQSAGASGWMSRHLSATGRMGHHDIKASQLKGAEVKSSSGETLGTISDQIVNPGSGRMDFAILSLSSASSSSGGATSPSGTTSGTSTSPSSSSSTTPSEGSADTNSPSALSSSAGSTGSTGGKQVAVPWLLLRPSSPAGGTSTSSTTTPAGQTPSFTFIGDPSKLQSAPAFDENTDVSQASWRQSVFSYFGLTQPGASTGGAESPGGTNSGSSGSSAPQTPGSSSNP